jgi:branched-chain amino acid aminotransferase
MKLSATLLLSALASASAFLAAPVTFGTTSTSTRDSSLSVAAETRPPLGIPGTAELDKPWKELGFEFRPTKSNLRVTYKNGEWGEPEMCESEFISLHMGATALHYGQACFEGLKAFTHEDGSVHVFRPSENAKRLQSSCERTLMPVVPHDVFLNAINEVVRDNIEYVPPYGTGGSLYLRPLLFGSGPRIGLQPADEYTFIIMVIPVGDYYKGGLEPVDGVIITDFDRAAPRGVGNVKVAGNYAADMLPNMRSKEQGFPIGLYLDAATQTCVEEFSTSNFVGIDSVNKKYVTPKSSSVLPSITNKSLMTIAEDEGFTVEARDIPIEEMETFDEVLACGTAVVVTPVGSVTMFGKTEDDEAKKFSFGDSDKTGAITKRLYDRVRAIQFGEEEDTYGWNFKIE